MTQEPVQPILPRRSITTLADLDTVDVMVEIEDNGEVLEFPLRLLKHYEWMEIGFEVPEPAPPIMGTDKQGRPLFDHNNPDYKIAVEKAQLERNYRRLAASLKIDIPGDTRAEKVAALQKTLSYNICNKLFGAILQKAAEGKWRVQERAETFHSSRNGNSAGALASAIDGSDVERSL